MQTTLLITMLLIAGAAAKPAEQQQQAAQQPSQAQQANQASASSQQQGPILVAASPPAQPAVVVSEVNPAQQGSNQAAYHQAQSSYYSPSGVIAVYGANDKPAAPQVFKSAEQYGQPESAALPPNYKPFGSWGLYIGGNPADGYYTNYYKALSEKVNENKDKVGASVLKASAPASGEQVYYPYSQGDFATVYNQHQVIQPVISHYGSPQYEVQGYSADQHADAYSARKASAAPAQKDAASKAESKAYNSQPQSRVYVYSPPVASHVVSPVATRAQVQEQQQQQVVAYPVPVGSQIVGSQSGVDGSFYPYGVHAYTRYVVKPTFVGQEQPQHSVPQQPAPVEVAYQQGQGVAYQASQGAAYQPIQAYAYQPSQGVVYQTSQAGVQQPQIANRAFYGAYQPYYTAAGYYPANPSQLHYSKVLSQHYSPEFKPIEDHPFNVAAKPVSLLENKPSEEARSPFNEAASNEKRA